MSQLISSAAQKNWERLGITAIGVKLKSRANKTQSDRIVFPVEYFSDKKNIPLVQSVVDYVSRNNVPVENVLYSIALRCFEDKGFIVGGKTCQQNVRTFIDEYHHISVVDFIYNVILPFDETDLLGLMYQCLQTEGNRNRDGMYYTSSPVANILLRDVHVSKEARFIDPCCGSGNLLLNISATDPKNLFGIDSDPIAVMIAKCNMIMKYPENNFYPNIFHKDFLETDRLFAKNMRNPIEGFFFDYVITNPPWGAVTNLGNENFSGVTSNESFSAFLVKSMEYLSENGKLRFLLPESFLHIKTHSNIRSFILKNYCIEEIRSYPHSFSGVSTKFIDVTITKKNDNHVTLFCASDKNIFVKTSMFMKNKHTVFSVISNEDNRILDHVHNQKKYDLSESVFALGIVTGDNKSKLYKIPHENLEAIYSGKEVDPYRLLQPKHYIKYNREQLQQAAKESIYRSNEKLVYKFISRRLVFAYDNSQSLFLNSANLLIPNVKGMNIKTVLAFLNSELYQFIYQKQFTDIKVLKGNLIELPFPVINNDADANLTRMIDTILSGDDHVISEINNVIYDIFHLNNGEKKYIQNNLQKPKQKRC
jgi:type I restriction-modification system DNA methylase subunit